MKNLKNSVNRFLWILFTGTSLAILGMESPGSSLAFEQYVKGLMRVKFGFEVRAFMYASPEDSDTQMLNRYLETVFAHYQQLVAQGDKIKMENSFDMLNRTALCRPNLQKIFQVSTNEGLKMQLGMMGIVYDFSNPCNTWNQCFLVVKTRILRKIRRNYSDI